MLGVLAAMLMQAAAPASPSLPNASAIMAEPSFYPEKAFEVRVQGVVTAECTVVTDGALRACVVVEEDPPGWGFGVSIFKFLHLYRLQPQDGVTIATSARRRIRVFFSLPPSLGPPKENPGRGPLPVALGPHFSVTTRPDWKTPPTTSEIKAYYPGAAAKHRLRGSAILRCRINVFGSAVDCSIDSEDPPGAGFGEAALRMSSIFRMRAATRDGTPVPALNVPITVSFQ